MRDVVAAAYRRWAHAEAEGVSDTYFAWAMAIADAPGALERIATLPTAKWQPNLVFAAARAAGAPLGSPEASTTWLEQHWASVEPIIRARSTQTNEAGRCAVLLPALSRLTGPVALIEAGASAGLCLFPDRYSYRYAVGGTTVSIDPPDGASEVIASCTVDGALPPVRLPDVAWRAGVDLHPIDPRDAEQVAWLETLVWPEHEHRRRRLHAAAAIAAEDPPRIVAGDIVERIPSLVAEAPPGSHVVVFHSAVLAYLTPERRAMFVEMIESLPEVTWISNEGESVLPTVDAQVAEPIAGMTVLAVNGRPMALVGPHGQRYRALDAPAAPADAARRRRASTASRPTTGA